MSQCHVSHFDGAISSNLHYVCEIAFQPFSSLHLLLVTAPVSYYTFQHKAQMWAICLKVAYYSCELYSENDRRPLWCRSLKLIF